MSESPLTDLLQLAIQDIKQGNLKAGKMGLARIIDAAPGSIYAEKAWIWMSATFNEPDEKRICLENALKINPDNVTAQKGLAKLPPPALPEMVNEAPAFEDPAWLIEDDVDDERTFSSGSAPKTRQIDDPIQKTPRYNRKTTNSYLMNTLPDKRLRAGKSSVAPSTSVQLQNRNSGAIYCWY